MQKPIEKPESRQNANREVNDVQKQDIEPKKPPPAKSYVIKKTWL